ncbi:hypothetical protein FRC03_006089 [Tulasnella sp. 419]|nr:hypothetical protein FRC03_006089 [Tulasnella sp. 419]
MTITSHLNDAPSQPRWSAPATRESIVPTVSREQDRPLSTFPNSATSTHDVSEIIASSNLTSQPSPPGAVHPRRRSAPPPPPTRRSNTHTIPQERSLPSPRNSGTSTQNISEGAASTSNPANQSSSLRLSAHQLSFVRSLTDRGVSGIALTSIVESMLAQNDGTIPTIPLVQQGSTNQNGADRIERVASPPPSYQPFDI